MSLNLEQHSGLSLVTATGATAGANLGGLSGAATTFTTSALAACINGIWYTNAAVTAGSPATPTTDVNTGAAITLTASKARAIVWLVNSAGTEAVAAGPIVDTVTGAPCQFPSIPSGYVPFATHVIQGGSTVSGTWTFGSSNWNATGITIGTIFNLAGALPGNALVCA